MTYIISGNIIFNPHDHTIENGKDDEFVKLSIPASRLLEQLLLSGGELVTRDFLLAEVWDKNGLRGSNNNLNQYMSILRRTLLAYGCDNLFITIPKIGFRLNPEIKIEFRGLEGEAVTSLSGALLTTRHNARKTYLMVLIALCCLLIPLFILFLLKQTSSHYDIANSDIDSLPSGCQLIYLHKLSEKEKTRARGQISSILKELHLSCTKENTVMFDNIKFIPDDKEYGKTFVSYCHNIDNNEFGDCTDYYYSNWKLPDE